MQIRASRSTSFREKMDRDKWLLENCKTKNLQFREDDFFATSSRDSLYLN